MRPSVSPHFPRFRLPTLVVCSMAALILGCQPALGSDASTSSATTVTTRGANHSRASRHVARAGALLAPLAPGSSPAAEIARGDEAFGEMEAAVRAFLDDVADLASLAADESERDHLAAVLAQAWAPRQALPELVVVDVGGTTVLLVSYPVRGLPVQAFSQGADGRLASTSLDPGLRDRPPDPPALVRLERVVDLTGDGQAELVLSREVTGGSGAVNTLIGVLTWDGQGFVSLFRGGVNTWGGDAGWDLVPHGATQDVVLRCPAFGPYDHKHFPHPTLRRVFRWDAAANQFILAGATLSPPTSRRDAFNRAEVALSQGDLATARAGYERVIQDSSLRPDRVGNTDWPALAWLRLGQVQALQGEPAAARESLRQMMGAGEPIATVARAFATALDEPDGIARGFAAIQAQTSSMPSDETAKILRFDGRLLPQNLSFIPGQCRITEGLGGVP